MLLQASIMQATRGPARVRIKGPYRVPAAPRTTGLRSIPVSSDPVGCPAALPTYPLDASDEAREKCFWFFPGSELALNCPQRQRWALAQPSFLDQDEPRAVSPRRSLSFPPLAGLRP